MSLTCFLSNHTSVVGVADQRKYHLNPDETMKNYSDDGFKIFQASPDFIISMIGEVSSLANSFVSQVVEKKLNFTQTVEALQKFYDIFKEQLKQSRCCISGGGIVDGISHLFTSTTIGFKIRVYVGNEMTILAGPPDYNPDPWLSPVFESESHDLPHLVEIAKGLIKHSSEKSVFVSPTYDLFTLGGERL